MRKKDFRGRCEKRSVSKCEGICKTFDVVQSRYVDMLSEREDVQSFRTNVPMEGLTIGEYTSDIVAVKTDGSLMVRECTRRANLLRTKTCTLLDASREYWLLRGVMDWGIVVETKEDHDEETSVVNEKTVAGVAFDISEFPAQRSTSTRTASDSKSLYVVPDKAVNLSDFTFEINGGAYYYVGDNTAWNEIIDTNQMRFQYEAVVPSWDKPIATVSYGKRNYYYQGTRTGYGFNFSNALNTGSFTLTIGCGNVYWE